MFFGVQEKLVAAARARIGRMMAPKKKRKDLDVSDEMRAYWVSGNKKEIAELFKDLNFSKVPRRILQP